MFANLLEHQYFIVMKQAVHPRFQHLKLAVCLVFVCAVSISVYAGDIFVRAVLMADNFQYAEQDNPFDISIENQENFPVNDVEVSVSYRMMGDPTVLQQDMIPLGTVDPLATVNVSTFQHPFFTMSPGMYDVQIDLNSSNDINPTNDQHTFQLNLLPQPNLSLYQVDMQFPYNRPMSNFGIVSLDLSPLEAPQFANFFLLNPMTESLEWMGYNIPLIPFPEQQLLDNWFNYDAIGNVEGTEVGNVLGYLKISSQPIESLDQVQANFQSIQVEPMDYNIESNNPTEVTPSPPSFASGHNVISIFGEDKLEYRGCNMSNIDLDNGSNGAGNGWTGDRNACGPAAAANSMQWLAEHDPNVPDNGQSIRDKMKDLASFMDRQNNAGVTTEQLVKGKLGFIDKHKLPIKVKYSSWFNTDASIASPNNAFGHKAENKGSTGARKPPSFDFLMQEMLDGEDVEIMWGWYDRDGNRHGGHWVSLSGATEVAGIKYIWFKDDSEQGAAGGTRHSMMEIVEHPDGDWFRVAGFNGPNNNCWVESVVSESYDSTITFTGIEEYGEGLFQLAMFPNPVALGDPIALQLTLPRAVQPTLRIYTVSGQMIYEQGLSVLSAGMHEITVPSQAIASHGVYIVRLETQSGTQVSVKVGVVE